jgi:heptaprenyl diphosphate synthase
VSDFNLSDELAAVEAIVAREAAIDDPRAAAAVGDLIRAGGKLLRPRALLLSAALGDYDPGKARPLAAAVELLHTATLVHDDVIDDSPTRRGAQAVHERIGRKDAVLAGDFLFSRCFSLVSGFATAENARAISLAISAMARAEIEQDSARWSFSPSVRSCLRKAGGKTAALFCVASRAGAIACRADDRTVSALTRASWAAGVAFQLRDDILDWVSDGATFGKATLRDVAEGLCTLPLAFALSLASDSLAPLLAPEAVESGSATDIARVVRESGAVEKASAVAFRYVERSLADLGRLPRSDARDGLAAMYSSFGNRAK